MFIALLLFLFNWAVWLWRWLLLSWVTQLLLKRLAGFCALASASIFRSSAKHTPEEQLCCGNIADVLTLGRWKVWVTWCLYSRPFFTLNFPAASLTALVMEVVCSRVTITHSTIFWFLLPVLLCWRRGKYCKCGLCSCLKTTLLLRFPLFCFPPFSLDFISTEKKCISNWFIWPCLSIFDSLLADKNKLIKINFTIYWILAYLDLV